MEKIKMNSVVRLAALCAVALVALAAAAAAAQAAPVWDVKTRWADQVLQPGAGAPVEPGGPSDGEFYLRVKNFGDTASEGPVTVTLEMPDGVTRVPPAMFDALLGPAEGYGWSCEGTNSVTCTRTGPVAPFDLTGARSIAYADNGEKGAPGLAPLIFIRVNVAPGASGVHAVEATVSGGGAPAPATDLDEVDVGGAPATFGIADGSFEADVFAGRYPSQERVRQAGDHPFELRVDFDLNLRAGEEASPAPGLASPISFTRTIGDIRTVEQTLPVGFIGNPEATPKCEITKFLELGTVTHTGTGCPPETQVGVMDLELNGLENTSKLHGMGGLYSNASFIQVPVYNLDPPKGVAADFGFSIADYRGHIYPTLDAANGYAIKATVPDISSILPVRSAEFVMWGVPADPAHDPLRMWTVAEGGTLKEKALGASSNAPIRPLLTMPMSCGDHGGFKQRADSWQRPGQWTPMEESQPSMDVTGCDDLRIRFDPEVALKPTSQTAGGPTGLRIDLKVPQRDQTVKNADDLYAANGNVHGVDTPPMKKAVVTLPDGMTISTSAAQGLASCSPQQIGLGTNDPVTCPDASQYGTLTINTPILPKDAPMTGRVFIAEQDNNPFNSFLALYLVIQDFERDLLVKIPGRVDLDPRTGQIKTTFDDLPQFPVSNMSMQLKGGIRAALVNPTTCGTKTIKAEFYSWADPDTPVTSTSSYEVGSKADGSPCVSDLGQRPFRLKLDAGTVNPLAGAYSPFVYRVQRGDDDQEISAIEARLPHGLLAKIAGLAKCPDAAIAAAEAPGRSGTEEASSPSCPAASQIGSTDVGSGVGQVLTYVPGKGYLAGPYRGAPLSMVVITPILAGPYDLGVIAVRSAMYVDPVTTEVRVQSDPLPQIFKGIPVRIRDIQIRVDRPQTTLNPTSCGPQAITSQVGGVGADLFSGADDVAALLSTRFQTANCADLPFKPQLSFRLKGGTKRGKYPALTATLKARPGDANIARAAVTLPRTAFLAQEHIRTICTRVQFAANTCPPGSVYGSVEAVSPLLDTPLSGPVYLRSSDNPLPDLVAKLDGEIDVVLAGRIDSFKARIRNTFDFVPDAPVTRFTLRMMGGKKSLLVNSAHICAVRARSTAKFIGQNGKVSTTHPLVPNSACKKKRKGSGKKQRR